jgi:hypothetical protein
METNIKKKHVVLLVTIMTQHREDKQTHHATPDRELGLVWYNLQLPARSQVRIGTV